MLRTGRSIRRVPTGELGQRAVDLHRGPVHFDGADGPPEFRGQLVGFQHLQERSLRIRGGDDDLRVDRSSPFEPHADRASAPNPYPFHGRPEEDLDATGPRRGRQRIGQCAHPAEDEAPPADLAIDVPEEIVREGERGSRGRRAGEMANHAFVRESGFHLVRFKVLVEQFFRAVEEQAPQEVLRLRAPEEGDELGDRDRRGEQHRLDEIVDLGPHRLVLRIRRGVFLRELRDLPRGLLPVGPEHEIFSIGERAEALRIEGDLPQPELRELEVFDDLRPEESRHVGGGTDLESRRDLVRDARAANAIRPLHNEHAESRLREVVRSDQAVMSCADDDDVR